jgi:hypothetical protein
VPAPPLPPGVGNPGLGSSSDLPSPTLVASFSAAGATSFLPLEVSSSLFMTGVLEGSAGAAGSAALGASAGAPKTLDSSRGHDYVRRPTMREPRQLRA